MGLHVTLAKFWLEGQKKNVNVIIFLWSKVLVLISTPLVGVDPNRWTVEIKMNAMNFQKKKKILHLCFFFLVPLAKIWLEGRVASICWHRCVCECVSACVCVYTYIHTKSHTHTCFSPHLLNYCLSPSSGRSQQGSCPPQSWKLFNRLLVVVSLQRLLS